MGAAYVTLLERLEQARHLGVAFGLERVAAALAALGSPERAYACVHIAGTNGKGSTAAMTESLLRAAGVRTGLFTSPHLARFTERIRIAGREVDGDALAALDARVVATGVPLTYFEISAVLAFLAFAEAGVQVAVLETGLGGRLDATNVCAPVATAITSIAFDHMELLGDTLAAIAVEKAGIAKAGVPLLLGHLPEEAAAAVAAVAAAVGAPLRRLGHELPGCEGQPALAGPHQRGNAALAVGLTEAALGRPLPPAVLAAGLASVSWPGRLERLGKDLLLDCAHNAEGAAALVAALSAGRPRALVVSVVRGKPVAAMLELLAPAFDRIVATRSRNERSLPPDALAAFAPPGAAVTIETDPLAAVAAARAAVAPGGLVVVAGSIFLIGQVRAHLLGEPQDPLPGGDPLP